MAKRKKRKLQAASHNNNKGSKPTSTVKPTKSKPVHSSHKSTIPFEPEDRILLVGEGDFSFAKSIVEHHGCCDITATCLDSKTDLFEKYIPQAEEHTTYLEEEGQTVLYGIDATKLDKRKELAKGGLFNVVLFNFPHVGGKSTDVNRQVRFNQELLVNFFKAVQGILAPTGTVVVTLFEGEPYTLWNVRDLARHTGLEVQRSFKFVAEAYEGYSHARTLGNITGGGGWKGEDREARSYVFQNRGGGMPVKQRPHAAAAAKRKRDDESSSDEDEDG